MQKKDGRSYRCVCVTSCVNYIHERKGSVGIFQRLFIAEREEKGHFLRVRVRVSIMKRSATTGFDLSHRSHQVALAQLHSFLVELKRK